MSTGPAPSRSIRGVAWGSLSRRPLALLLLTGALPLLLALSSPSVSILLPPPSPSLVEAQKVLLRAETNLIEADAADRLFVRLARRFQSLPPARPSPCRDPVRIALGARMSAAWEALQERVQASSARSLELTRIASSESRALLLPSDLRRMNEVLGELTRLEKLIFSDRLILTQDVEGPLSRAGCSLATMASLASLLPDGGPPLPVPSTLSPEEAAAVGVEAGAEDVLLWVAGQPARVIAAGTRGVVTLRGSAPLCASLPEAPSCPSATPGPFVMGDWLMVKGSALVRVHMDVEKILSPQALTAVSTAPALKESPMPDPPAEPLEGGDRPTAGEKAERAALLGSSPRKAPPPPGPDPLGEDSPRSLRQKGMGTSPRRGGLGEPENGSDPRHRTR